MRAPLPKDEAARLASLRQSHILNTAPEEAFDDLTRLAAHICEAPMALISLVDADRLWFKSRVGLMAREAAREDSFCAWAILEPGVLIVPDAATDERFSAHPFVTANPKIRFYAGAPLITSEGQALGTLCALDRKPRELRPEQAKALRALADAVVAQLELKRQRTELECALTEREQLEERLRQSEESIKRIEQKNTELARTNAMFRKRVVECQQTLEELKASEERYTLAMDGAHDGLWDWNLKTDEVYFSPRWKAMLGYEESEIGNSPQAWLSRVHPEEVEVVKAEITAHLKGLLPHFQNEHRVLHRDGTYRWMFARGLAVRDSSGAAYRLAGSQTDITRRREAEEQLLHEAFHDPLTGLPNRAMLMTRLKRSLSRVQHREDYLFAVLFLDVDRFKVVNDSLGHQVGDQLLIAMARRLEDSLRPGDMVARLGGDEFAIILDRLRAVSDATHAAERVQKDLMAPFNLNGHEVFTTASIGVALSVSEYERAEELIRDADTAMYRAKDQGRGRFELFDTGMHSRAVSLLQLETDLRRAIERKEFRVHYQPIVSLKNWSIMGFEALLRWHHPQHGVISPVEFIAVAEETGLIIPIGLWVLHESCRQMREWQWQFPADPPLFISVNLSGKQFSQPDLIERIQQILIETGLEAGSLKLEITESAIIENTELATDMLEQLKALGVRVSLDDFGTGYSSLSYLHRFPIDTLKIDRSFITRLDLPGKNSEIVHTIVTLARNLGMDVIAEGVETGEQIVKLDGMRCEYGQGYLFSKPLDGEAVKLLIEETYQRKPDRNVGAA